MDLSKLKEPFKKEDIEWRLQQSGETNGRIWGKCLAYVTVRAIETRLDEVCGAENWKNEFKEGPNGGILCGISIKIGDEWITKWDGSENTDFESVKGGLSGAMKRSAVQWGIGRYLYDLEEGWAVVSENGIYSGKTKEGKWFKWNPPVLPAWALPGDDGSFSEKTDIQTVTNPEQKKETSDTSKRKGRKTKEEDAIKETGNTIIQRIGLVMKRQENGANCFSEAEINQIRGLVAKTPLTETGIKELEELENVVRMELESRLQKAA